LAKNTHFDQNVETVLIVKSTNCLQHIWQYKELLMTVYDQNVTVGPT